MFDQAFSKPALAKCLQKHDFLEYPKLADECYKIDIIEREIDFSKLSILTEDSFSRKYLKRKLIFKINGLEKELVLRRANDNLRRIYKVKQNDRDLIIQQLISSLKDGLEYNLYKLDIESFYESFAHDELIKKISNNPLVTYNTKQFVINLLKSFIENNDRGLPRGISISATLSELAMIEFDKYINDLDCVYFYFRYVDDIIIITDRKEERKFVANIEAILPNGLVFHKGKKRKLLKLNNVILKPESKGDKSKEFDFLGYKFYINHMVDANNAYYKYRDIHIDIATSKVGKIKTRIIKSFIHYIKTRDFNLLDERVKFLTSNFRLLDKKKNIYVMSGIFYNYKRIEIERSKSISDLDNF